MASIKRKKSGGEGGANWMDTYGDMVTLLLCFFVLLYSMSTIDQEKWMIIVQSFNKDAEVSIDDFPRGPDGNNDAQLGDDMPMTQDEINDMQEMILEQLAEYAASLSQQVDSDNIEQAEAAEDITTIKGDGWIFMKIPNEVLFGGDSDELTRAGREALAGIIPILEEGRLFINQIQVTGHTATAQGTYNASWDQKLSAGRAAAVAAYIQDNSTIQPARIVSQGRGQWLPIAPNDNEEDRRKNRRVELFISFMDEQIDNPFAGSIEQYYTMTEQENPDPLASMYGTTNTAAE